VAETQSAWTQTTLVSLQDAGFRWGGARRAVIELLGRQDCCLTAQEIFDELRASGRPVGVASIYRVLDLLTARRLVQRVGVGGGPARYEAAHEGGEHHHHVVCDDCGKVEAFGDEGLERAIGSVADGLGYRVEAHDVVLRGACGDCRTA